MPVFRQPLMRWHIVYSLSPTPSLQRRVIFLVCSLSIKTVCSVDVRTHLIIILWDDSSFTQRFLFIQLGEALDTLWVRLLHVSFSTSNMFFLMLISIRLSFVFHVFIFEDYVWVNNLMLYYVCHAASHEFIPLIFAFRISLFC